METVIGVVWTVGLVGALVATGAVLKLAALVLRTLKNLLRLAERTATAADGVARNLQAIARLEETHGPAERVAEAAATLRGSLGESGPPKPDERKA